MNWKLFRDPWVIVALILFLVSLWLAWPLFTFRHFPHVTARDYTAMAVMIVAHAIVTSRHGEKR
jgi:hypothetical protein